MCHGFDKITSSSCAFGIFVSTKGNISVHQVNIVAKTNDLSLSTNNAI